MTFLVKVRGDTSRPIMAEYTCPDHGPFACFVQREANGDAPDVVACPHYGAPLRCPNCDRRTVDLVDGRAVCAFCGCNYPGEVLDIDCNLPSTWTPSLVACKVKRFEVVRGGWQKPERKTYLDTRDLGEGQDIGDFREKRKEIWEEKRRAEVKELLR